MSFGFSTIAVNIPSGLQYQGGWNALTNVPALASGVGTSGDYYIVTTAGNTNLDGITDWQIGDWAIFSGTVWQKIDNTDSITGSGTANEITYWSASNVIGSLSTVTYPSLTELSYVKGVTSGIQTQLNNKEASLGFTPVNKAGDTMLGALQVNANITSQGQFIGAEPNSTATNRGYSINTRDVAVTFPVPTIQPTTNNSVIAVDIMPKGTPVEDALNGYAWFDVCSADVKDNNNAVNTARVASASSGAIFASKLFNGATAKPLRLIVQTGAATSVDGIYIDNTGKKVGMNTTTPNYNLHIHQDATTTATSIQITNGSSGSAATDGLNVGIDSAATPNAYVLQRENANLSFWTNATQRVTINGAGSVILANSALATNATDRFTYIPSCAGIPTGVPTAVTGVVPMVYDSTNNNFYIYNAGWKKVLLS